MKRTDYYKILEILDNFQDREDELAARHCELNADCTEEVRQRRRYQGAYNTAISNVRSAVVEAFWGKLEA